MRNTLIFLAFLGLNTFAQQQSKGAKEDRPVSVFDTTTPEHDYNLLLYPDAQASLSVSVLFHREAECYIEYSGKRTPEIQVKASEPVSIALIDRKGSVEDRYRLAYRFNKQESYRYSEWKDIRFNPAENKPFVFTIAADSHLDENCDPSIYEKAMHAVAASCPAFHMDLGDTFMVDKYREDYTASKQQYLAQRYYLGIPGEAAPVFLVQGNHDGETMDSRRGMTEWSREQRQRFFPGTDKVNYYSFNYANTLFLVLDPFGFTPRSGSQNPWDRTLGQEQYEWLEKTLRESKADHKFVFIHNLVGGVDIKGKSRGGAEAAKYYEWGGLSEHGVNEFQKNRPALKIPVHELLKQYQVDAVFHGHDHVYASQQYDGVKYICLPQPGYKNKPGKLEYAREYGYIQGVLNNVPGFIKVTVRDEQIEIAYLDVNNKSVDDL